LQRYAEPLRIGRIDLSVVAIDMLAGVVEHMNAAERRLDPLCEPQLHLCWRHMDDAARGGDRVIKTRVRARCLGKHRRRHGNDPSSDPPWHCANLVSCHDDSSVSRDRLQSARKRTARQRRCIGAAVRRWTCVPRWSTVASSAKEWRARLASHQCMCTPEALGWGFSRYSISTARSKSATE